MENKYTKAIFGITLNGKLLLFSSKHTYFFLLALGFFLITSGSLLFSEGMFLDGLTYASVAKNMASGLGSFWVPHYSNCLFDQFYEHPPLALGLQSLWFSFFGDSIFVERFYALFTYLITGLLIAKSWQLLTREISTAWMPILLWVGVANVSWAVANNMLENTMTLFTMSAVYFLLKQYNKPFWIYILAAGFSLFLAFLTKGFFPLYLWGLPFFLWVFTRKHSFGKMLLSTVLLVFFTVVPLLTLLAVSPEASTSLLAYLNKQVLGSISSVQTVNSRFSIVIQFFENAVFPIAIMVLTALYFKLYKKENLNFKKQLPLSLALLCVVLSGILPIMISLKQRAFYILTVYPIFSLALAYLLYPAISSAVKRINVATKKFTAFKVITTALFACSIAVCVFSAQKVGRDKDLIHDMKLVLAKTGHEQVVAICPKLYQNWTAHAYFQRYGQVSLCTNQNESLRFYLKSAECDDVNLGNYTLVELGTNTYHLYERNDF